MRLIALKRLGFQREFFWRRYDFNFAFSPEFGLCVRCVLNYFLAEYLASCACCPIMMAITSLLGWCIDVAIEVMKLRT